VRLIADAIDLGVGDLPGFEIPPRLGSGAKSIRCLVK
jgi:hypothetical protein